MKQSTILTKTLQSLFTIEEQKQLLQTISYKDSARKFTVRESLKFWLYASLGKWTSFRESEERMNNHYDLISVDHSTLSKKASEIPFQFYQKVFNHICTKCNREQKRRLSLPVFAVDSTTITVGMDRLPWAYLFGEKSGIKLHIRLQLNNNTPTTAHETIALQHDSEAFQRFQSQLVKGIQVFDRAYSKYTTNLFLLEDVMITDPYRSRWQIELFFRWIKQHLNVKRLFGTTPNAVYSQLFAALITIGFTNVHVLRRSNSLAP